MLAFNGYIPLRRGVLEHLHSGKMTPSELVVFTILLTWADHRTGVAITNGPGIVFLSGEQLKLRTVQDALNSLEKAGYIKRPFYVQGQRGNQRIFIDKFIVTGGALKDKQLSFADTKDWDNPAYVERGDESGEGRGENGGVSGGADRGSNKKIEVRIENEEADDDYVPQRSETDKTKTNPDRRQGTASPCDPALTGNTPGETPVPPEFATLFETLTGILRVAGQPSDLTRLSSHPVGFLTEAAAWAATHGYWSQVAGKHVSHFVRACLAERGLLDQFEDARKKGKAQAAAASTGSGNARPARQHEEPKPFCLHGDGCSRLPDCDCWCHKQEGRRKCKVCVGEDCVKEGCLCDCHVLIDPDLESAESDSFEVVED